MCAWEMLVILTATPPFHFLFTVESSGIWGDCRREPGSSCTTSCPSLWSHSNRTPTLVTFSTLGPEVVSTVAALCPQFYFGTYIQPQGQAVLSGKGGSFRKYIQSLLTFGVQSSPSDRAVVSSIIRDSLVISQGALGRK